MDAGAFSGPLRFAFRKQSPPGPLGRPDHRAPPGRPFPPGLFPYASSGLFPVCRVPSPYEECTHVPSHPDAVRIPEHLARPGPAGRLHRAGR
ncbi:protein of unknown function [Streptomyces sp. KY75]|nr:protein of unknown function [Streptomyces sp. KY75]CAD5995170.1 protein of unknown function [Streptomyces sp. KY70]